MNPVINKLNSRYAGKNVQIVNYFIIIEFIEIKYEKKYKKKHKKLVHVKIQKNNILTIKAIDSLRLEHEIALFFNRQLEFVK